MTSREDLIRESLELEAEFLDDLGETEEAAKVRARIPKTDAELKGQGRNTGGRASFVRDPHGHEVVVVTRQGRSAAYQLKTGRSRWGRKSGDIVPGVDLPLIEELTSFEIRPFDAADDSPPRRWDTADPEA